MMSFSLEEISLVITCFQGTARVSAVEQAPTQLAAPTQVIGSAQVSDALSMNEAPPAISVGSEVTLDEEGQETVEGMPGESECETGAPTAMQILSQAAGESCYQSVSRR